MVVRGTITGISTRTSLEHNERIIWFNSVVYGDRYNLGSTLQITDIRLCDRSDEERSLVVIGTALNLPSIGDEVEAEVYDRGGVLAVKKLRNLSTKSLMVYDRSLPSWMIRGSVILRVVIILVVIAIIISIFE